MSKKALYIECNAGISGDMTAAALLDLGADETVLRKALESLPLEGYRIQIGKVEKAGLSVNDFNVILDAEHENHDHDMAYLYGDKEHHHGYHHHGEHEHHHSHDDADLKAASHEHHHHHHHMHRSLSDIMDILKAADLTDGARTLAERIFRILGEAEAKAHGKTLEDVHFHEVGAVDSIVDIVAAAVCFDNLGIDRVIVPELCEGHGEIRCAHGRLPIPVPAVTNIVTDHGLYLHRIPEYGEFVTPTGAAIAAAVMTSDHLPEEYRILGCGMGAGKREYDRAGILRIFLIEPKKKRMM